MHCLSHAFLKRSIDVMNLLLYARNAQEYFRLLSIFFPVQFTVSISNFSTGTNDNFHEQDG